MKTLFLALVFSLAGFAQAPPPKPPAPPQISADLGPCSAEFRITTMAGKPIYNAKITVQIRHGIFGTRKLDLEIGTDANGQATFVKLPAHTSHPLTFNISTGQDTAEVGYSPATNCAASYVVPMGKKPDEP